MRLLIAAAGALAACSFSGGNQGNGDGDADAAPDADITPPDCECVANEQVCMGEPAPIPCPLDCNGATGRCNPIAPSNNADGHSLDLDEVAVWNVVNNVVVNTDDGSMSGGTTRAPGAGVISGIGYEQVDGQAVFVVAGLSVSQGATIRLFGSLPTIIRTSGAVDISGQIHASAGAFACGLTEQRSCPGPGGGDGSDDNQPATGCGPGGDGEDGGGGSGEAGGGGGGGGVAGARGGNASGSAGGSPGAQCITVEIIPLVGGSGGGRGGDEGDAYAAGGGGGGAIQISSDVEIVMTGGGAPAGISASGQGGAGAPNEDGGGGGGAGGAILLEAPAVHLEDAILAANGGAGGGADGGSDGEAGRFDATAANGQDGGGDGGTATPPEQGNDTNTDAGGGGGAAGVIRINTNDLTEAGTNVRSPPETNGAITAASQ